MDRRIRDTLHIAGASDEYVMSRRVEVQRRARYQPHERFAEEWERTGVLADATELMRESAKPSVRTTTAAPPSKSCARRQLRGAAVVQDPVSAALRESVQNELSNVSQGDWRRKLGAIYEL